MPAPVSEPLRSTTSRRARAPRAWPGARDAIPRPSWVGCTPITPRVLTRSGSPHRRPTPLCAQIAAALRDAVCAAQRTAATPPREGADPAPRWTLKRLMLFVRERFGRRCCRETIRTALHRRKLSWKKAKKLLGRADPERRQAFIEQLQDVLAGAQRDRYLLVYVDEAPYEDGCVKPVLFSAGRHRSFPRVLAFLGAEVELRAARVPSPTSYPAGRCPRHDPLFGSEELRGERRHSTSAALSGSPRFVPAAAPSAPPDQFRPAVLARSVYPCSPVLRRPVSLLPCRSRHRSVRRASAPSPAARYHPGGIARARPAAFAPGRRS